MGVYDYDLCDRPVISIDGRYDYLCDRPTRSQSNHGLERGEESVGDSFRVYDIER